MCRVLIAGDVVLAGTDEPALQPVARLLHTADLAVCNLEGIPAAGTSRGPARYHFAFPPERLAWLGRAGFSAAGLANNHAGDAGAPGVVGALRTFAHSPVGCFGVGASPEAAVRPWLAERKGVCFAFFAVSCVESLAARSGRPGVAALPDHASLIEKALREAKEDGCTVIVLAHWGDEYTTSINASQREWTRWLIQRGADVIAGAHPHVLQPLDTWRGRPVAFSLGNAVYPHEMQGADCGALLELQFNQRGELISSRQIPLPP